MTGDCVGAQSGTNCLCPRERYLAPAMNAIFASILPIFALIVLGTPLADERREQASEAVDGEAPAETDVGGLAVRQ